MKYYTLTETVINDTETMTLLKMDSQDKCDLVNTFQLRRQMLLNSTDVRVIKDNFDESFISVMTDDGNIINLSIIETTMV